MSSLSTNSVWIVFNKEGNLSFRNSVKTIEEETSPYLITTLENQITPDKIKNFIEDASHTARQRLRIQPGKSALEYAYDLEQIFWNPVERVAYMIELAANSEHASLFDFTSKQMQSAFVRYIAAARSNIREFRKNLKLEHQFDQSPELAMARAQVEKVFHEIEHVIVPQIRAWSKERTKLSDDQFKEELNRIKSRWAYLWDKNPNHLNSQDQAEVNIEFFYNVA